VAAARRSGHLEHDDLVRVDHGREPVRDDQGRAPLPPPVEIGLEGDSVRVSRAEVASSSTRTGGFFSTTRAIATRCFSPP
jgi:hypothetical protein